MDAGGADRLLKAQVAQHMHRVGTNLDAGADLAELWSLLVDFDLVAGLHQAGRRRQSAEPRPCDQDFVRHTRSFSYCGVAMSVSRSCTRSCPCQRSMARQPATCTTRPRCSISALPSG